jgi:hypothetical protein
VRDLTLLYYTANTIANPLGQRVRQHLMDSAPTYPLISISHEPMGFGANICVGETPPSTQGVYRQILLGAKAASTPFVACCEDDSLYCSEHFEFRPPLDEIWYNLNRWHLDPVMQFRWRNRTGMCACIAPRELLIETLEARFKSDPDCKHPLSWGEPGKYEGFFRIPKIVKREFNSITPIIHINHGGLGGIRKGVKTDIVESELPYWGSAKDLWNSMVN